MYDYSVTWSSRNESMQIFKRLWRRFLTGLLNDMNLLCREISSSLGFCSFKIKLIPKGSIRLHYTENSPLNHL